MDVYNTQFKFRIFKAVSLLKITTTILVIVVIVGVVIAVVCVYTSIHLGHPMIHFLAESRMFLDSLLSKYSGLDYQ